jgi:hypothetical protein
MVRALLKILVTLVLFLIASHGRALSTTGNAEKRQLRARQKTARKLMTAEDKNVNKVLRNTQVPKAQRVQLQHQVKRDKRELRRRQKDERQDLRDRQRVAAERSKHA